MKIDSEVLKQAHKTTDNKNIYCWFKKKIDLLLNTQLSINIRCLNKRNIYQPQIHTAIYNRCVGSSSRNDRITSVHTWQHIYKEEAVWDTMENKVMPLTTSCGQEINWGNFLYRYV